MNDKLKLHLEVLGFKVKDKVTDHKGVVTSISYDISGCIQYLITTNNGDSKWFDGSRVKITSKSRVIDLPDYSSNMIASGLKGPTEKPLK